MNSQKVEQTIKGILEEKGEAILQNRSAFRSAAADLLDDVHYPEERLVLKHAMDANVFWTLLGSGSLTTDGAKKAAEQLAKESHMQDKDAEFVVQCVAAARGITLEPPKPPEPPKPEEPEPVKPEPLKPEPEPVKPEPLNPESTSPLFSAECKLQGKWTKAVSGTVYLYQNRLRFEPYTKNAYGVDINRNGAAEISYNDMKKLYSYKKGFQTAYWVLLIFFIILFLSGGIELGVAACVLYGLPIACIQFAYRKTVGIRLSVTKVEFLLFASRADKKQALAVLQAGCLATRK